MRVQFPVMGRPTGDDTRRAFDAGDDPSALALATAASSLLRFAGSTASWRGSGFHTDFHNCRDLSLSPAAELSLSLLR